ncbi:MAG TPA: transcription antitermination factor NusB [Polyangiaceae bacterium]|nr:transcription antitermination factor NusB [Polyangiaceae bacterium]
MGARTSGREAALQMLFALEVSGDPAEAVIRRFWQSFEGQPESKEYAEACVRGVTAALERVDGLVREASLHWRLERMTRVDRNVLRVGAWELLERHDVPRAVILDEAVEMAKRFGTEESGPFVNGVLDRVADNLGRKDR